MFKIQFDLTHIAVLRFQSGQDFVAVNMALKQSQSWQIVENLPGQNHLIFNVLFLRDDTIKNTLLALAKEIIQVRFKQVHIYIAPADSELDEFGILNIATKDNSKVIQLGVGFSNAVAKNGTVEDLQQWISEQYDN